MNNIIGFTYFIKSELKKNTEEVKIKNEIEELPQYEIFKLLEKKLEKIDQIKYEKENKILEFTFKYLRY